MINDMTGLPYRTLSNLSTLHSANSIIAITHANKFGIVVLSEYRKASASLKESMLKIDGTKSKRKQLDRLYSLF